MTTPRGVSATNPLDKLHHFKAARLLSYTSEGRTPGKGVGAILHKGNRAVSFGVNSFTKTHPIQCHTPKKLYLHAEISALIKRRHYDDIGACSITVYREAFGKPAMAKPCAQCQIILSGFGIQRVYYSTPAEPYYAVLKL